MSTTHRVGDVDRARTQTLLGTAHALGYLQPDELDERLGQTLTARTADQLAAATADLPVAELRRRDPVVAERRRRTARRGVRLHAAALAAVSTLLVATWLAVAIGAGAWFPWPVFPVLGGLAGLGAHHAAVRAGLPAPGLLSGGCARALVAGPRR